MLKEFNVCAFLTIASGLLTHSPDLAFAVFAFCGLVFFTYKYPRSEGSSLSPLGYFAMPLIISFSMWNSLRETPYGYYSLICFVPYLLHLLINAPQKYMPKNYTVYLIAASMGRSLKNIPKIYRDQRMCLATIRNSAEDLGVVPTGIKTEEFYEKAIKKNKRIIDLVDLETFPIKQWNPKWFRYITNVEIRRQFIREHGAKIWEQFSALNTMEEDDEYTLIKFKYDWGQDGIQKALIYNCPSSKETYFTQIAPNINSLREALRFLNNGVSKEELEYES